MSISVNLTRLDNFFNSRCSESSAARKANRLYDNVCIDSCALIRRSGDAHLNHTTVALCAGERGIAACAAFPIRCMTDIEKENTLAFLRAANERLGVGHLSMNDGCVCFSMGVDTEGLTRGQGTLLAMHTVNTASVRLAHMTPAILSAMRGGDVEPLAEYAADACTPLEREILPWEAALPSSCEIDELTAWLEEMAACARKR